MNPWYLAAGFLLDQLLGDPPQAPHPVRMIGRGVTVAEQIIRSRCAMPRGERWGGVLLVTVIVGSSYGLTWWLVTVSAWIHPAVHATIVIYLSSTVLAVRSLRDEAWGVLERLARPDLQEAQRWLSRLVGRETEQLDEPGVIRATVETVAENTNDGVVAPLFYLAVGGVPLAMAYKAINTLDSMVGYRTPRYLHFGWASARLDDLANYLPARITGLLIVLASGLVCGAGRESLRVIYRDGRRHDSPNAGIPEAAVAGALGIQLGGPSRYFGAVKTRPWLGDASREIHRGQIEQAIRIMEAASWLMLILCLIVLGIVSLKGNA